MTTVRQLERLWDDRQFARLASAICAGRSDIDPDLVPTFTDSVAAAALAVIRLDELGQTPHPLAGRLVRALLAAQLPDGGWGEVATSALAIRALRCGRGEGLGIARGVRWLAELQQDGGAWPAGPLRRLPPDAPTTAFLLLHLGADPLFNAVARVTDALAWLGRHQDQLPAAAGRTAQRVAVRRRSIAGWLGTSLVAHARTASTPCLFANIESGLS
jgi:hypothetical protein